MTVTRSHFALSLVANNLPEFGNLPWNTSRDRTSLHTESGKGGQQREPIGHSMTRRRRSKKSSTLPASGPQGKEVWGAFDDASYEALPLQDTLELKDARGPQRVAGALLEWTPQGP